MNARSSVGPGSGGSSEERRPARALAVTVDLGNSRLKLCAWRCDDESGRAAALPFAAASAPAHRAQLECTVRAFARALRGQPIERVGFSSVADLEATERLLAMLAAAWGERVVEALDPGLGCAVEPPSQVGRDRLFAARAAFELVGPALVVDAGTALTVDGVRADPDRTGSGRFEGGAIAAGPRAVAAALGAAGARLFAIEPAPGVPFVGRSSRAALESGVVHGFRGAARELIGGVAGELGLAGAPVVITGGARRLLLEPPLWDSEAGGAARVVVEPELVHRGLLAALADRARAKSGPAIERAGGA